MELNRAWVHLLAVTSLAYNGPDTFPARVYACRYRRCTPMSYASFTSAEKAPGTALPSLTPGSGCVGRGTMFFNSRAVNEQGMSPTIGVQRRVISWCKDCGEGNLKGSSSRNCVGIGPAYLFHISGG